MLILFIDLAVIATIVFCGWRGYRNGLIRGAFGVVALIAALIIANVASKAYSEEFTGMLQPFIGGLVEKTLSELAEEDSGLSSASSKSETQKNNIAHSALRRIGLPEASASRIAEIAAKTDDPDTPFADILTDKLCSVLAFVAVFGIGFILLSIVFAVVGNLVGFVFALPGLKLVDSITGVLFGLCKGLLIVLALATIVRYFGLLAQSTLEETKVLQYIVNKNIVANMLGL